VRHAGRTATVTTMDLRHPPTAARLLDAVAPRADDASTTLGLVACTDGQEEAPAVVAVGGVPSHPDPVDARRCLALLAAMPSGPRPGVLLTVARAGGHDVSDNDRRWVDLAHATCRSTRVELVGVWLLVGASEPRRLDAPLPQPAGS